MFIAFQSLKWSGHEIKADITLAKRMTVIIHATSAIRGTSSRLLISRSYVKTWMPYNQEVEQNAMLYMIFVDFQKTFVLLNRIVMWGNNSDVWRFNKKCRQGEKFLA